MSDVSGAWENGRVGGASADLAAQPPATPPAHEHELREVAMTADEIARLLDQNIDAIEQGEKQIVEGQAASLCQAVDHSSRCTSPARYVVRLTPSDSSRRLCSIHADGFTTRTVLA